MAVFTSVLCGSLLPMAVLITAGWLSGNVSEFLRGHFVWLWPVEMAFISFAAFWSACLVKGTVRAALLAFPVCMAVSAGVPLGEWLAQSVVRITAHPFRWLISAVGPIEASRLALQMAPIMFHPNPF